MPKSSSLSSDEEIDARSDWSDSWEELLSRIGDWWIGDCVGDGDWDCDGGGDGDGDCDGGGDGDGDREGGGEGVGDGACGGEADEDSESVGEGGDSKCWVEFGGIGFIGET